MNNTSLGADACLEQLNAIFKNFMRLYLFCNAASVRVRFDDEVYSRQYFVIDDTQYPVYLDSDLTLKAYEISDASPNAKTLLTATEKGFEYSHVLLMTSSGILHKAFEEVMKSGRFVSENYDIALSCAFEVDGIRDFGTYDKLKSVKLCGLAYFGLQQTSCQYLAAIKKHGEVLDLAWCHVATRGPNTNFSRLSGEIALLFTNLDVVTANLSQRQLQLAQYNNSLKPLLEAIKA